MLGIIGSSANNAKISDGSQPGDLLATGQNSFGSTSSNFKTTINLDPLVKLLDSSFKSLQKTLMSSLNMSQITGLPNLKI